LTFQNIRLGITFTNTNSDTLAFIIVITIAGCWL